jgi:hypothetical protein
MVVPNVSALLGLAIVIKVSFSMVGRGHDQKSKSKQVLKRQFKQMLKMVQTFVKTE